MSENTSYASALQQRLGATLEDFGGHPAAAHYGSVEEEFRHLQSGCGLVLRTWATCLEMGGQDRLRFLGGQATCEVKDLAEGQGIYGFFTSVKGRVESDVTVYASSDRLWLELPPEAAEAIQARLEKYIIFDQVTLAKADTVAVTLVGTEATSLLAKHGELPSELHHHRPLKIADKSAACVREPGGSSSNQGNASQWTLWLAPQDLEAVCQHLQDQGAKPTGWQALEQLRIEAGRPRFGIDFNADNFPKETGLEEEAVSYTKGCYLGQEVVARIHYRGGVQKRLCRLLFDKPGNHTGAELKLEGRTVGKVGSVAPLANAQQHLGLAIVHGKAPYGTRVTVGDGTEAGLEAGTEAEVVEL